MIPCYNLASLQMPSTERLKMFQPWITRSSGLKILRWVKLWVCTGFTLEKVVLGLYEDRSDLRVKYMGFVDHGNSNVIQCDYKYSQTKLTSRLVEGSD